MDDSRFASLTAPAAVGLHAILRELPDRIADGIAAWLYDTKAVSLG